MGLRATANPAMPAMIELHIEELVLHGFPATHRLNIGDALQDELQRLLAEQGFTSPVIKPINIGRLDAGSFQVAKNAKPGAVGTQLARQLHRQLSTRQNVQPYQRSRGARTGQ